MVVRIYPDKIQITNKRNVIQSSYKTSKETSKANYLGVTIDNKLSWNSQTDTVTKRVNQTTTLLRRNLSSCPNAVKPKCYKSIVRPQLVYASTVWNPVTKSNIAKLESVQRRAARFCCNDIAEPTVSLQELGWEDLQSRRPQNKAAIMYTHE